MSTPWMPFYVADYLQDTGHLSTVEHGAYMLLIMHYWANRGLPKDDARLARLVRLPDREWAKIKGTIAEFFDGEWQHGRIDAELAISDEKRDARAKAGQKGGFAASKSRRKPQQSYSNATAELYQPQPHSRTEEPNGSSGANAPRDIRADLFGRGLQSLASMTGKTPDSCRSLVGRWLKTVKDEAIHVLAAIDDAERNRVADPVAWITATLNSRNGGSHVQTDRSLGAVARAAAERATAFAGGDGLCDDDGRPPLRVLLGR